MKYLVYIQVSAFEILHYIDKINIFRISFLIGYKSITFV